MIVTVQRGKDEPKETIEGITRIEPTFEIYGRAISSFDLFVGNAHIEDLPARMLIAISD